MYVSKSEIEQYLGLQIDSSLDAFITTLTSAAEKYIEKCTGRKFENADSDTTRKYNGNGLTMLAIDDLRSVTSVTADGIALTVDTDYVFFPLNAVADGYPYERIDLIQPVTEFSRNSRMSAQNPYYFYEAQGNVTVTGKFGYSVTPPADIKVAALKLIGGFIKENIGDSDLKEITSESLGEYSVSFTKISEVANKLGVDDVLSEFKRKPFIGDGIRKVS